MLPSFDALVDAATLLGVALIGTVACYGAADYGRRALVLLRTERRDVRELEAPGRRPEAGGGDVAAPEPGRATVAGTADADAGATLTAPLSGEPCLAYALTEWSARFPEGGVSDAALDLQGREWWEDDAADDRERAEGVPVRLRDATGTVRVDPRAPGAGRDDDAPGPFDPEALDVDAPTVERTFGGDEPVPERLAAAADRLDLRPGERERWRYVEERVPPGELVVTGRVVREDGRAALVNDGGVFVVSDTPAAATARSRAGVALVLLLIGLGALGLVAAHLTGAELVLALARVPSAA